MSAASLLASWQNGQERIILQFNGTGPISLISAEAMRNGEVRAYVSDPSFLMAPGTPLGMALRTGTLKVTKILYDNAHPYHSIVPLEAADITSDLLSYYKRSEQIPAHAEFETYLDFKGDVTFSGGYIIEALPAQNKNESNSKFLDPYKERLLKLPPISVLFGNDAHSLRTVLDKIAPGEIQEQNVEKLITDFYCRCNKDKFKQNLKTLNFADLTEFFNLAGEERSLTCQYCSKKYILDDGDMKELFEALEKKNEKKQ